MTRVVGFLELKALDDGSRTFEGWASRTETDRQGDIVESAGATFKLPLPLLLDHDHRNAIGSVIQASVTAEGIRFKAKIADVPNPGPLKSLCDDAWAMVKSGLRRAVSIGFRPLDASPMSSGGYRFHAWEWCELSIVAVPALASATIDTVKSYDLKLRSTAARRAHCVVKLDRPLVTALETELDRDIPPLKGLSPADDMVARSIAAIARTSDECFRQIDARMTAIELAMSAAKNTLEMDPDEFLAHFKAQRRLGRSI